MWIAIGVLLVLAALLLFLEMPALRRHPDRAHIQGRYIAHRGLHDQTPDTPENSLAAFRAAVERVYAIENDIHLTADGQVVVFHDDTLDRMCGVPGRPEEKTLAQLKELSLAGTAEKIPTLQECLDAVDGQVPLLIEFKCGTVAGARQLCAAADAILSAYKGEYWVQSFYPFILQWYKRHRPDICRGQLSAGFYHESLSHRLLGCLVFNCLGRPDFISYEHSNAGNVFLRLNIRLGALPVCWTLRSPEELERARRVFRTYIFERFIP